MKIEKLPIKNSNSVRIAHACLRYPPATGGVETYVKELVEKTHTIPSLDHNNPSKYDVRVLTSKMRTHGPISELAPEQLLNDPPYVQRLHHASTPLISYPRLQALNYYLSHHQPDIIHGYSFWYQPADVAARYARRHHLPFIFHPMYYTNQHRQKPLWQLYKSTIGTQTFAAADVVVVISPYEQELIEQSNLPVRRFELIPPGVDIDKFDRQRINPFIKRRIAGPVAITVSRLAPGKGLDEAIDIVPTIIKTYSDFNLVIIGEDFGHQNALAARVKQLGISSHVHFLGKISDEELIAAYQHADLLIHPSHYEAFGIVLAESLAAGTPTIARNIAAIPYVTPHQSTGLLFNNSDELAQHILTYLDHPDLRQQHGRAGITRVTANFTWDQSIKKLTDIYGEFSQ